MSKRGNGEGSIYEMKDGRWRAAVSDGFRDGKPVRKIFTAKTRDAVQKKLTKALNDQLNGVPLANERTTLGAHLKTWLEDVVKPSVRPKTYRTYTDLVRIHIQPNLGNRPLAKLVPGTIRTFLNDKSAAGLSPATVKHLLVLLRSSIGVAVKDGAVARNAAALVDPPRAKKRETHSFTPEQARAFLDAIKGDRMEALFTAAVSLGLRQGEILGLAWSDVDLEAGTLTVRAQLQRIDDKLVRVEPKSANSRRQINLPAVAVSSLHTHRSRQNEEREWAGSVWQETGYVFTTGKGTPMDPRNVIRRFHDIVRPKKKIEGAAVFPPLRFHDLRHSAATLLLAQGVSPRYISDLLGHSQVSFTMQTYAHVLPQVRKDVASKMDEILNPVATSVATKAPQRVF